MKRKACELDGSSATYDWPASDSSNASSVSPESVKTVPGSWRPASIPYINMRTRKRYRDGRPDDETIHQKTLAKLYEAQKQLHTEEVEEHHRAQHVDSYLMSLDIPAQTCSQRIEQKQKSIESFFGGSNNTRQSVPRELPFIFTSPPILSKSTLSCEGCGIAIQDRAGEDAMDVDMAEDDLSCQNCSKRVCDMCAVRGDQRICLECAVPGG